MNKRQIEKLRKSYNGKQNSLTADIANRLNGKGITTKQGKEFSYAGVLSVLNGTYQNENIEKELGLIIEEQKLAKLNATV